jgi:hypothetical protein
VRPADRGVVAALAVFNFYFGWRIGTAPGLIPGEKWWALLFIAAGSACIALEARFLNRELLALAGATTTVAYASRAAALVVAMQRGQASVIDTRVQAGIAVWTLLTYLSGYIFIRVLRPLLEARRAGPA